MRTDKKIHIPGGEYVPPTRTERIIAFIKDPHKQNAGIMLSTVATAIFTGFLTVVSFRQLDEMHSTNDDTRKLADAAVRQASAAASQVDALQKSVQQAKAQAEATTQLANNAKAQADSMKIFADNSIQQADAMKISAETSRRSLGVTIDSFQQDQRAWVGPMTTALGDLVPYTTVITTTIKNTGRTPAFNLGVATNYSTFIGEQITTPTTPRNTSILFPGEIQASETTMPNLTQLAINKIIGGTATLYVIGFIEYDDVFRKTHRTYFRLAYDPRSKKLMYAPTGNEAN